MREARPWLLVVLVLAATPVLARAQRAADGPTVSISGAVYDSIGRAPLRGITVMFAPADDPSARSRAVTTDDEGSYEIPDLAAGLYLATFFPTPLDTLGFEIPARSVNVQGRRQRVDLGTPSSATLRRTVCGEAGGDSTATLIGRVTRTETAEPISGSTVSVEWSEVLFDESQGFRHHDRVVSAETRGPGWFAICALPGEVVVTARASHGADSSGFVEIELAPGELRHFTFLLGGARSVERVIAAQPDSALPGAAPVTQRVWVGRAGLRGTVHDADGDPVGGAVVSLWGTVQEATTNANGTFVLDALPAGTQTVEARLIGFEPVRRVVQLRADDVTLVDIMLAKRVVVLENVRVRGELVYGRNLAEFERRRRTNATSSFFLGPDEIEARPFSPLPRLLQTMPGVGVICVKGTCRVSMRGGTTQYGVSDCTPALWVDGRKEISGDFDMYWSDMIAAIEIYPRPTGVPIQYAEGGRCGAILIWTRPLPSKVQKPGGG